MDSLPRLARLARGGFLFFVFVVVAIIVTGGGKLKPLDFISVGAWAAPAALLSFYLNHLAMGTESRFQAVYPQRWRALVEAVAARPYLLAGAVFFSLGAAHFARMLSLNVNVFDAGFLYPPIFHAFSSPLLACDLCYRETFLAVHQAYTLPLLFPFAALAGSALIFPVIAVLLGFISFRILGHSFRKDLALPELSFLFLALFAVRGFREAFIFDLREDLLGALFFFVALAVARTGRIYLALLPLALAALSKETGVLLLPFAGLAILIEDVAFKASSRANQARGIAAYSVLSVALFVGVFLFAFPALSPHRGGASDFAQRLAFLGKDPGEIFSNLFVHPFRSIYLIASNLGTLERLKYVVFMLAPFLYFMVRAWNFYYLPGFVLLAGNLISSSPQQRMMQFHYELFILPFFAFGLAESIRRLKSADRLRPEFLGAALLFFLCFSGTWPISHLRRYGGQTDRIADFRWARKTALEIPPGTPVLLDATTFPIFTERSELRYLGGETFDPLAANLLSEKTIGDSRFAIVTREKGTGLTPVIWRERGCGPSGGLCFYARWRD